MSGDVTSRYPKVDALFEGEPPLPLLDAKPRLWRIQVILAFAIPLDLLAIPCFTGVPGAVLTLWAYLLTEGEVALVHAGRYASDVEAARLLRLRRLTVWAMVYTIISFIVQILFFVTSVYDLLLMQVNELLQRMM